MRYITSIERYGMLKFAHEAISDMLRIRFKRIPRNITSMIRSIENEDDLKLLLKSAVITPDIATFQAELEKRIPATLKAAA